VTIAFVRQQNYLSNRYAVTSPAPSLARSPHYAVVRLAPTLFSSGGSPSTDASGLWLAPDDLKVDLYSPDARLVQTELRVTVRAGLDASFARRADIQASRNLPRMRVSGS